jgi:predicted dehydrogenase
VDLSLILMGFPKDIEVHSFMDRANYAGNAEDYVRLIFRAPGAPVADIELTASNAYANKDNLFLIQGTQGTLKGHDTTLTWKYFKPSETEPLKLDLRPLRDEKGEPIYCREKLNFHEESWTADVGTRTPSEYDFTERGLAYYRALHASFTGNTEFDVKNEQLMLQMKVMEAAHAQNKELFKR